MGLLIKMDETSDKPVFRQIMDRIIAMVDNGTLKPGEHLPSTRLLADQLLVNRSTVYRAYQELWALGYLESRPGSYSTVRKRAKVAAATDRPAEPLIDWAARTTAPSRELYQAQTKEQARFRSTEGESVIDFLPLSPDSRLFPLDAFRQCLNQALAGRGAELLQYGQPQGYRPLRELIADRMRLHSVTVSADEIMVTTGAQNAMELLSQLLAAPGGGVAFEDPTYSRALDVFRLNNLDMTGIPMTGQGLDLEALESLLRSRPPAFVYTIPNFQNPTGLTTDQPHREKLLRLCERYGTPLVEDGFEEEMKYFGKAVLPIKSMDRSGLVVYLGTFSKVLFPGLRIGWIAADRELIRRLIPLQQASILSGSHLLQAALHAFCQAGHYDLHIRRMHRIYRRRMQTALKAMHRLLDRPEVVWKEPTGGYIIWLRLKDAGLGEDEAVDRLFQRGVKVMPGGSHFFGPMEDVFIRLSIAHLDEDQIEEGFSRLGQGLQDIYGAAPKPLKKARP